MIRQAKTAAEARYRQKPKRQFKKGTCNDVLWSVMIWGQGLRGRQCSLRAPKGRQCNTNSVEEADSMVSLGCTQKGVTRYFRLYQGLTNVKVCQYV